MIEKDQLPIQESVASSALTRPMVGRRRMAGRITILQACVFKDDFLPVRVHMAVDTITRVVITRRRVALGTLSQITVIQFDLFPRVGVVTC
jgi:hypothetical protein